MPISVNALKVGDLLFTYISERKDGGRPTLIPSDKTGSTAGHATMVTSVEGKGRVRHTHAVDGRTRNGLWETNLTVPKHDAGNWVRVVRCCDDDLAKAAAKWAIRWHTYWVPFGSQRRNTAVADENRFKTSTALVKSLQARFHSAGRFRAIKYAARRLGFLCYPTDEEGLGLFCSQFVVLCYQVAGLGDAVNAVPVTRSNIRVTDEKASLSASWLEFLKAESGGNTTDWKAYCRYAGALLSGAPSAGKAMGLDYSPSAWWNWVWNNVQYVPSISLWDYSKYPSIECFHWGGAITQGMMIDSRVVMPQGLYESLVNDSGSWRDLGYLTGSGMAPESRDEVKEAKETQTLQTQKLRTKWGQ